MHGQVGKIPLASWAQALKYGDMRKSLKRPQMLGFHFFHFLPVREALPLQLMMTTNQYYISTWGLSHYLDVPSFGTGVAWLSWS